MATSRRAAIGATRLARSGGRDRRGDGDDDSDDDRGDDRRGRDDGRSRRDVEADLGEQLPETERHPDPQAEPGRAGDEPDRDGLEQHRTQHLPPAGADRTQHREVTGALGDHDRERVVDDEHADEQRDVGERQQEGVEELQVLAELSLLVGGVGLAGEHLDLVVGERRLQAHRELVGADIGRLGDHDAVEAARLTEQLLGSAEVGRDHRRAGDPLDLAERRLADERELDRTGLGQHGERVADRPAFVGHGGAVDDGLVGGSGSASIGELERVEPGVVDPRRSDRRAQLVGGDLTVVTHELGETLDRAGRGVDSIDIEHAGERRLVHALPNLGHRRRRSPIHAGRWRRRLRCWWRAHRRTCVPWCR